MFNRSLQLKVKRLEEEKPDLEISRSETDKKHQPNTTEPEEEEEERETKSKKLVSSEESDRENRSVNGSNSTGSNRRTGGEGELKVEPGTVQAGSDEPAPVVSGSNPEPLVVVVVGEGSCDGSESDELGDSVSQLSGGDVQSSASLGRKRKRKERRRRREVCGDGIIIKSGIDDDHVKSEPLVLVGFLEMIRAHQHGSLFERLLQNQV